MIFFRPRSHRQKVTQGIGGAAASGPALRLIDGGRAAREALPVESARVAARHGRNIVFLALDEVCAFEAAGRLLYVHSSRGRYDIDLSLAELEACPIGVCLTRVHRSWLVNRMHVRQLCLEAGTTQLLVGGRQSGEDAALLVPVARDLVRPVRELLLGASIGLRRRDASA